MRLLDSLTRLRLMTKEFCKYIVQIPISLNHVSSLTALLSSIRVFLEKRMLDFSRFASWPDQLQYFPKHLLKKIASLMFSLHITKRSSTYMRWEIEVAFFETLITWIYPLASSVAINLVNFSKSIIKSKRDNGSPCQSPRLGLKLLR